MPRFVTQSEVLQPKKSVRQPIAVQQAINEVKVNTQACLADCMCGCTRLLRLLIRMTLVLQANAKAKFDETMEIAINLGTNPKRGDQAVRGTALLPFGTGKSVRIAAFAEGEDAVAAAAAGELYLFNAPMLRKHEKPVDTHGSCKSLTNHSTKCQPLHTTPFIDIQIMTGLCESLHL